MEKFISIKKNPILIYFSLAFLVVFSAWQRSGALNPPTLWFDDVWAACTTFHSNFYDLIKSRVAIPLGFNILQWGMRHLISDPEISLQLIPFIMGLILIPFMYLNCSTFKIRASLSLFAALIICFSPPIIAYSYSTKQYSIELFCCLLLLYMAQNHWNKSTIHSFATLVITACVSFLFSFSSPLISIPLICIEPLRIKTIKNLKTNLIILGFVLYGVLLNRYLFRDQINHTMYGHWLASLGIFNSWNDFSKFLTISFPSLFTEIYPKGLGLLSLSIPLGLIACWNQKREKALAYVFIVFLTLRIAFASIGKYPIGVPRTDSFAYPLFILMSAKGFEFLLKNYTSKPKIPLIITGFIFALFMTQLSYSRMNYGFNSFKNEQLLLNNSSDDNTSIIVHPYSSYDFAFYAGKKCKIEKSIGAAQNFMPICQRSNLLTLRFDKDGREFQLYPNLFAKDVEVFLTSSKTNSLIFYDNSVDPKFSNVIRTKISNTGYKEVSCGAEIDSILSCYKRI